MINVSTLDTKSKYLSTFICPINMFKMVSMCVWTERGAAGGVIRVQMYLHVLFMGTALSAAVIFRIAINTLHQTLSNLVALQ